MERSSFGLIKLDLLFRRRKKVLGENFNNIIRENRRSSFIMSSLGIIMTAGLTFTFAIPGLKGFEWTFLIGALGIYFIAANIFAELFKEKLILVLSSSLVLSTLGMGGRLWLEWGEFSLIEHMHPLVIIGYPTVIALIISLSSVIIPKLYFKLNDV